MIVENDLNDFNERDRILYSPYSHEEVVSMDISSIPVVDSLGEHKILLFYLYSKH